MGARLIGLRARGRFPVAWTATLNPEATTVDGSSMSTGASTRGLGRLIYPSREELARRHVLNAGEEKMLDVLNRELEPEWELYVQPHLNGLRPDFLCLHASGAAAVVEVKDWTFDSWALTWRTREGAAPIPVAQLDGAVVEQRNPIEQIYGYRSLVAEMSEPSSGRCLDVRGVLVFPFATTRASAGEMAPAVEHRHTTEIAIVGSDGLGRLGAMPEFTPISQDGREGALGAMRDWLVDAETTVAVSPDQLTRRQRELITSRTESGCRRIRGAPGSGKSVVLAARAAELSRQDKDVLVVCFNLALVSYLRKAAASFGAVERRITFLGFHEWCQRVMTDTGRHSEYKSLWKRVAGTSQVLNEDLPEAVARALDGDGSGLASRYDAVLVDEGQDYYPEWWGCLRRVRRGGGEMVLAADPGQNLFGRAQSWTESAMTGAGFTGPWVDLGVSHRMPWDVIVHARSFAERFLPTADSLLPEVPPLKLFDDSILSWRQVTAAKIVDATTGAFVSMLGTVAERPVVHALLPGEVVLLADSNATGKSIVAELAKRGVRVSHTFDGGRSGRAAKRSFSLDGDLPSATTPYSFKGWEAPAIVVCIKHGSKQTALAMLYSAITRLKAVDGGSLLTVVCAEPRLAGYGKSWPNRS